MERVQLNTFELFGAATFAFIVALLLFPMFFDGWKDFFMCNSRFPISETPGWDRMRGYWFYVIVLFSGIGAFAVIHLLFR